MTILSRWFAWVLAACSAAAAVPTAAAQQSAGGAVPLEAFFGKATLQSAQLSPSGRWLATQQSVPGSRVRLVVSDLQDKEPAKVIAAFERADVAWFRWVNDDLLIFSVSDSLDRSALRRFNGLASARRDGERIRLLIKRDFDTLYPPPGLQPLEANHYYMAMGAPGTDEIIVGEELAGQRYQFDTVRPLVLNARTGERRSLLDKLPADADNFIFDAQGRARVSTAYKEGVHTFRWLDLKTGEWRVIATFAALDADFWPAFVNNAGELYVHVDDSAAGGAELRKFDFATNKVGADAIVATPGFSGSIRPVQDRRTGELQALSVLTDARATVWLSPAMQEVQTRVDASLPGRLNILSCRPCDSPEVVLVHSSSDRMPGEYLIYRPQSKQWQRLGFARPAIDPRRMAGKEFHRIKARDGSDLPVWITRPTAVQVEKPRAAVVLVHGGPWVRGGEWEWDPEGQFLASRGYVVVEPEFRGSTGYGDKHYRAGWKQWGQAMQDDITDALRFAVERGWVDASRVCIAGASYGGYATLMGVAKDPDQYRCGVAWVAVSDPRLMFSIHWSDISDESKKYGYPALIGDPKADAAMLAANAPLELASRIKAPLLLAYGAKDRRVPVEHGELMRSALRKAGKEPEWVVYDDEGHGWYRDETTFDFWRRVEVFLARHLSP